MGLLDDTYTKTFSNHLFDLSNKEQRDKYKLQAEYLAQHKNETGINEWDRICGGLPFGQLSIICAGTGVGKSTWLLSMAKHMAKRGNKCLYITIEQSAAMIFKWVNDVSLFNCLKIYTMDSLKEWPEVIEYIKEQDIKFVFYDYLGALSEGSDNEWQALKLESAELANLAKDNHIHVMTAMQATYELDGLSVEEIGQSKKYVAYSKNTINACSSAVYLVREKDKMGKFLNQVRLAAFKFRYLEMGMPYSNSIKIDYGNKEFIL